MGSKVYFLVEADESNADPVSRMMTQLLDQMKNKDSCCKDYPPPENMGAIFSTIPVRAPEPMRSSPSHNTSHVSKPKCVFKQVVPGECLSLGNSMICSEPSPCAKPGLKSSIVAEATVDNTGQANAKIFVNSDTAKKESSRSHQLYRIGSPPKNVYSLCERRNGLEPTLAEIRGKKVFYLPINAKIPSSNKCPRRPSILSDNLSTTSINSRYSGYYSNQHLPMVAEMKRCARNIPEERLIKYNACISRRDGMQDWCDPLSRKALRKCKK